MYLAQRELILQTKQECEKLIVNEKEILEVTMKLREQNAQIESDIRELEEKPGEI